MLDADTKQRIDRARNILVGVLPMPQAQIDQITYALIYKFMDDMDQQSVAIGGKPSFFTDEFAKFAWTKIFDPRLGGYELHTLYTDALAAIPRNPNIPQFIRTVFKNALLPYRNPETLKLFLKTINEFQYSQNDHLGDAFEYLLQTLGSQGDAGQFLTPRHIIDFMVQVVDPKKNETILDPACGTAGFLVSSYLHILKGNQKSIPGDLLTAAERASLPANFTGYDISAEMVRLALTNLYLHGFTSPRILEYDSLTSEEHWDEYFNVILANPPFMSPTGGIRPHKRFSVQANRSEVLFVDYIAEHLTPSGRAAIIVPEGIIFQSGKAYKQLRKMLVEQDYLWAVVSLPSGVFNPYSGVKTSILFLDKELAKKTDQVLFIKIENVGFSLGANRTPIHDNDLPVALESLNTWKNYKKSNVENDEFPTSLINVTKNFIPVNKTKIIESKDFNLTGDRYKDNPEGKKHNWPTISLGEVADYINGYPFKPADWKDTGKPIIRIQNLTGTSKSYNYTDKNDIPDKYHVSKGDLLISWSATIGFFIWDGPDAYLNQHIFKVEPHPIILKEYLFNLGPYLIERILGYVHGNTMRHITKDLFNSIKIPLPPLEVQREIVAEIEGYQRIIDGARQVVDNWKPNLEHELELARKQAGVAEWVKVKLSQLCDGILSGGTPSTSVTEYWEGEIPWMTSADIVDIKTAKIRRYITEKAIRESATNLIPKGNIIVVTRVGLGKLFSNSFDVCISQDSQGLLIKKEMVDTTYLLYVLEKLVKNFKNTSQGTTIQGVTKGHLSNLDIPIPPLNIQKSIADRIDHERDIIQSNQNLVNMFEEKIKQVISRVWESE